MKHAVTSTVKMASHKYLISKALGRQVRAVTKLIRMERVGVATDHKCASKIVKKAADLIFAEALDLLKIIAQKIKFYVMDFFSKCDQMRRKLRIWSHLLNEFLMENFTFYCSDCTWEFVE